MCPANTPTLSRLASPSIVARYSGKVSKVQSMPSTRASKAMPSTFSRVRAMVSRCSGRVGAIPKPQLPTTTLVTPCQHEGVRSGSQRTWAS